MAKVRRAIKVWGAVMKDGTSITNEDPNVVSVIIHPDGSVSTTDPSGRAHKAEGTWATYNPRFN
jgi:hypothetical protein